MNELKRALARFVKYKKIGFSQKIIEMWLKPTLFQKKHRAKARRHL